MSKYQYPTLTNEKEFELLINDLCKKEFDLYHFQLYGRKGQKQNGIDGIALDSENNLIVYQCKNKLLNREDKKIQEELINDLINEVKLTKEDFIDNRGYTLKYFIFANSFKQDTRIQNKANELTSQYGFNVIVWSWDEIENLLNKYMDISLKYYPFQKNLNDDCQTLNDLIKWIPFTQLADILETRIICVHIFHYSEFYLMFKNSNPHKIPFNDKRLNELFENLISKIDELEYYCFYYERDVEKGPYHNYYIYNDNNIFQINKNKLERKTILFLQDKEDEIFCHLIHLNKELIYYIRDNYVISFNKSYSEFL